MTVETYDEINEVRNLIQTMMKAKKVLRMYPQNNPIFIKTIKDVLDKFRVFFESRETLQLQFNRSDIFYNSESVYHNSEKHDNLALMFFKDGLRELTIKQGVSPDEIEDFLKIISNDFDKDAVEDDIVTLLWERDFENINYVVEDTYFSDEEDYEKTAVARLKEKESSIDTSSVASILHRSDGQSDDSSVFELTEDDFSQVFQEIEKDGRDKTHKLFLYLLEMFHDTAGEEDYRKVEGYFTKAIEFTAQQGKVNVLAEVQARLKNILDGNASEEMKKHAVSILWFSGSQKVLDTIGMHLDNGQMIEEDDFRRFVGFLDTRAIMPLVKTLGELKSIQARKKVIDALVVLGSKDVSILIEKLNDTRWYVVRNIVHILRKIGDNRAVPQLAKTVKHADLRVKKEVIRALGDLGGDNVLATLQNCLNDADIHVRKAALTALGSIGSQSAKRVILDVISHKNFNNRVFEEKKECFHVLSRWNDNDVYGFLVGILKKNRLFGRAKHLEKKACAAYCLGLLGSGDAVPILNEFRDASHKQLREYSCAALKRMGHGV